MAQLDACLTGDQEVGGLTPAGSANSFMEIDHEVLPCHSLLSPDSRRGVVSVW